MEPSPTPPSSSSAYVGPDYPCWTHVLDDGRTVTVRPLGRQDAEADRRFIKGLSAESRRARFLGGMVEPSDAQIEALTDIDYVNEVALAATVQVGGREDIVGVARYATDNAGERCECAVVVADAWQGHGLATALMKRLIRIAQERGLRLMESYDLAGNIGMHDLARSLGFHVRRDPDDAHQLIYALPLNPHRPAL